MLRDGRKIVTNAVGELSHHEIIRYMIGREIGDLYAQENSKIRERVILDGEQQDGEYYRKRVSV